MSKKRIAVDFDGVIHAYTQGWQDGSIYDAPIPDALKTIIKLSHEFEIYIFTTRARKEINQVDSIRDWLIYHATAEGLPTKVFEKIIITNEKIPAIAYIDDRGIRFTNWIDIKKYFS